MSFSHNLKINKKNKILGYNIKKMPSDFNLCADEVLGVAALTQLEQQTKKITQQLVEDDDSGGDKRMVNGMLMMNQLVALSLGPVKRIACGSECLPKNITHELITRRFVEYMVLSLVNLFKKSPNAPYPDQIKPEQDDDSYSGLFANDNLTSKVLGVYGSRTDVLFRMMLFCLLQRKSVSSDDASKCECDVYKYGLAVEVLLVSFSLILNMTLDDEYARYVPDANSLRYFTSLWEFLITNKDFVNLFCEPCDLCPPLKADE